jgi:excinuclease ABC subunit A
VVGLTEIEPRNFSFNSPHGACPVCTGLGTTREFDPDQIFPNKNLSIAQGAVAPWLRATGEGSAWYSALLEGLAAEYEFSLNTPVRDLPQEVIDTILNGVRGKKVTVRYKSRSGRMRAYAVEYEGVIPNLKRRYASTSSDYVREELERYMAERPCPECHGARLKPEVLAITIEDRSVVDITRLPIREAQAWFNELARDPAQDRGAPLSEREFLIARQIFKEIRERLGFLVDVGLDYLTLERSANTLSGGEAQRIRLATQIGSSLMGVLYILDEPSIGLHQRDNARLIHTLER